MSSDEIIGIIFFAGIFLLENTYPFFKYEYSRIMHALPNLSYAAFNTLVLFGFSGILIGSSDKIQNSLGWTPAYNSLDAIVETAWRWHKK